MLKRLAILAIISAVISPSFPGHTTTQATGANGKPQNDSHGQQKSPTPSLPVINMPSAPNPQEHSANQESTKENVTVSTTEPLKVQADVSKDWRDKLNWLLSVILVVIGGFGVLYARKTLKAIERQANIASESLILQFRPRIVIRGGFINGTRLADTGEHVGGCVQFVVTNSGGTNAHIYKSEFIVKVLGDSISESSLMDGAMSIGEFSLTTGQGTTITIPISLEMVKSIQDEFRRRDEPLSADRKPVYVIGDLWYKDDLGISRSTGIFRKFDPKELIFVPVENSTSEYSD